MNVNLFLINVCSADFDSRNSISIKLACYLQWPLLQTIILGKLDFV